MQSKYSIGTKPINVVLGESQVLKAFQKAVKVKAIQISGNTIQKGKLGNREGISPGSCYMTLLK